MNRLKIIKDNSIVICNSNYKLRILKNINQLLNIKFISMNEFIKSYYFDYDEKSIIYLINKYNIKYEIALEYLNNLYYIEDKLYNNEKLDFLFNVKKELIENNLLIFNNKFKNYIKDKNIVIYKYSLSKFEKHLLKDLNITEVEKDCLDYTPEIYEFNDIEDEIEFIAKSISELINNGVDISQIKLTNVSNDYINQINKIFDFYNLKVNKFNNIPIISTIIGNTFYNNLEDGIVKDIRFDGEACAISTSATSIMIRSLIGKKLEDVKEILSNYQKMINEEEYNKEILEELNVYDTICKQPNRKNCALLPSVAVSKMLGELGK